MRQETQVEESNAHALQFAQSPSILRHALVIIYPLGRHWDSAPLKKVNYIDFSNVNLSGYARRAM